MYKQIRLTDTKSRSTPEAVAVALFENTQQLPMEYRRLDKAVGGVLSAGIGRPEVSLGPGDVTVLYSSPQGKQKQPQRVFVLGLGKRERFSSNTLRAAAAGLVRKAYTTKVSRLSLRLIAGIGNTISAKAVGRAVSDGMTIGNFEFNTYKGTATASDRQGSAKRPSLTVESEAAIRLGLDHGLRVGDSVAVARSLAATPPNVANPAYLVAYCRKMSRQVGLKCSVVDAQRAGRLGMNGLLAVGRAGSTPPALIALEHRPKGAKGKPILLVGKAVTFDTGGYSIKSSVGMESMKYDKCGGMAVIGAMHAIARLKLPVPVVGLVAAAENMVSDKAYRPSDIITMYNGVTVEVISTDAEGRLVLGDAIAYGCERYKPRAVIDLATLTGGVVVALGSYCAGVFCNDQKLKNRLMGAAEDTGERLWQLPLWPEHKRQLKGTHSDIVNSAGREAQPIQGAAFLSHFVDSTDQTELPKTPWAHVDIAGVSDTKGGDKSLYAKGPTGFGVRLLVQTVEAWGR